MSSLINMTYGVPINHFKLYKIDWHMRINFRKGLGERYIIAKGNCIAGIKATE